MPSLQQGLTLRTGVRTCTHSAHTAAVSGMGATVTGTEAGAAVDAAGADEEEAGPGLTGHALQIIPVS